ncbi:MAG: PAS-domain containing protein [Rhodocyclaceae bacterium]|nr:PAS-domain containing protein [Rhodocyclaceae bacterium]
MPSNDEHLRLFQTILDYLPSGVSLADKDLNVIAWNAEFKRLLKFPDELFGPETPTLHKLVLFNARRGEYGPGDPEEQARASVERARKMEPHVFERSRPDGTVLEIRGRPLPGGGFVTIYTDMTERKRIEDEIRHTASYFQSVLDNLPLGVLLADKDMRCVYWNKLGRGLFGIEDDFVLVGTPLEDVLRQVAENGGYGPGKADEQVARRMQLIGNFQPHTVELTPPRGGILQVRGAPIVVDGASAGYILLQEDITERKEYQATLERLATTDHLTGLLNRRAFLEATEREIRRAHRYGQSLSLLMLDVDHFKHINDSHGHPAGDEVLRRIAAACRGMLRDEDLTGRLGGEEFAVALVQAPLQAAVAVAERLRKTIGALDMAHEGKVLKATVSIGVAEFGGVADTLCKLVSQADVQLYAAKHAGRNRISSAQPAQQTRSA